MIHSYFEKKIKIVENAHLLPTRSLLMLQSAIVFAATAARSKEGICSVHKSDCSLWYCLQWLLISFLAQYLICGQNKTYTRWRENEFWSSNLSIYIIIPCNCVMVVILAVGTSAMHRSSGWHFLSIIQGFIG